jgi:hypothetical protein
MRIEDLFKLENTEREYKQSVLINFYYGYQELDELHSLESKLRILLYDKGIGELDGHEINMDGSDGTLFLYGHNAEELFKTIQPLLLQTPWMKKAEVYLRFGHISDKDAAEIDFILE